VIKFGALIFARMGSQRLPGKTLREARPGWTLLDMVYARAKKARSLSLIGVATGDTKDNDAVEAHCNSKGYPCFRGSEEDVLGRGIAAARHFDLEDILWLTGDNPFIDGPLIDDAYAFYKAGGFDYVATTHMGHCDRWTAERTFPRGVSIQIMPRRVLEAVDSLARDSLDRENGTSAIYFHPELFKLGAFSAEGPYAPWRHPELRLTIDTPNDWALLEEVLTRLAPADPASFDSVQAISLLAGQPGLAALNADVQQRSALQTPS
jgi:spore coat polysaccharide biosynthesis protein SpsF